MNLQESAEMYLKTVMLLEKSNDVVRAVDIARQMQFSRPTVSEQIKRLTALGFLQVNDKKQISLTKKGRQIAEDTDNRHNGLVDFFVQIGVSEDTAFEDACRIEHYISQETINCMQDFLQNCRQQSNENLD